MCESLFNTEDDVDIHMQSQHLPKADDAAQNTDLLDVESLLTDDKNRMEKHDLDNIHNVHDRNIKH